MSYLPPELERRGGHCKQDADVSSEFPPLNLNGINHRRIKAHTAKTNGFVEHFNGTVLYEFFRVKTHETFDDSVDALRADLDVWLVHYNTESDVAPSRLSKHRPNTHGSRHVSRKPRRLGAYLKEGRHLSKLEIEFRHRKIC